MEELTIITPNSKKMNMEEIESVSMTDENGNGFGVYANEKGFLFEIQVLVNGKFAESQITKDEARFLGEWLIKSSEEH